MRSFLVLAVALLGACDGKDVVIDDSGVVDIDEDGDGSPASLDCDDSDGLRFPGNEEVCDGIDNDCNEEIDDAAVDMLTGYADGDGDGYGDDGDSRLGCELGSGYVELGGDCDDGDAAINPAAQEICDANDVDEDCDGDADDADDSVNPAGYSDFYADADGDGYGDAGDSLAACDAGSGWVTDDLDCDDSDASVYPGSGCDAPTFDGSYAGTVEISGEVTSLGVSDVCVGTGEAVIDESGTPALNGTLTCDFQGILAGFLGTQTATFDGEFTSGSIMDGVIDVQDLTQQPWTGGVGRDGTLTGTFSGTETVSGFTADFEGSFTLTRQ